jgi:hypothetical protein
LDPLLASLRSGLGPAEPAAAPPVPAEAPVDPEGASAAAAQLARLLADFDPQAGEFVDAHRAALRGLFPGDSWAEFETMVQSYQFAEAQVRLIRVVPTGSGA